MLRPSIRARYLFHELDTLQVGHSTFEDAQQLAKKLGAKPDNRAPCDRKYCYWTAVVNNVRLPQWWRGSGVTFVIDFVVEDSVVVNKGAWYAIGIDPYTFIPSIVSVGEQETWLRPRRENRGIGERPTEKGWGISYFEKNGHRERVSTKFQVHLTPRSSADDWRRYTAFNYGCLWKYKGDAKTRETCCRLQTPCQLTSERATSFQIPEWTLKLNGPFDNGVMFLRSRKTWLSAPSLDSRGAGLPGDSDSPPVAHR